MFKVLSLLAVAATFYTAAATYGVDVASDWSSGTWECFKQNNREFAIVRAWHSYGAPDDNAPTAISRAWSAGFKDVDAYLFPCRSKSASEQVNGVVSFLAQNNVRYGMLWFDIEVNPSTGCGWSSDKASNCEYMKELVSAAESSGRKWGVYTSIYEWEQTVGSGCTAGSNLPLWYAHYDDSPSFSDFSRIGGWTKPAIKQYSGSGRLCGVEVDLDWYP